MSVPTQDLAHVTEGQGLLTSRYANLTVTKGLVTALMLRFQEIENQLYALINAVQLSNHPMAGGPWDILDKLGKLVGAQRNGLSDADFLALIKIKAKVNRARGLVEDVISLASLMAGTGTPPTYLEMYPAAFYICVLNVGLNYPIFQPLLAQVRSAGVYGLFIYSTWSIRPLSFGSRYDATAGQGGYGSRRDATVGGFLNAAVSL